MLDLSAKNHYRHNQNSPRRPQELHPQTMVKYSQIDIGFNKSFPKQNITTKWTPSNSVTPNKELNQSKLDKSHMPSFSPNFQNDSNFKGFVRS